MRNWYKNPERTKTVPAVSRRQLILGSLTLLCLAVLMVVSLTPRTASAPAPDSPAEQAGTQQNTLLSQDCQVRQHLRYAPCGHQLTRRQTLPPELAGQGRAALEKAYDLWQVTSFAADQVEMEQTLEMYCPDHLVLMPNESGVLCVFRNKYGDALALVSEMNILLTEMPDDVQEQLRTGKSFGDQEELDLWLEANES